MPLLWSSLPQGCCHSCGGGYCRGRGCRGRDCHGRECGRDYGRVESRDNDGCNCVCVLVPLCLLVAPPLLPRRLTPPALLPSRCWACFTWNPRCSGGPAAVVIIGCTGNPIPLLTRHACDPWRAKSVCWWCFCVVASCSPFCLFDCTYPLFVGMRPCSCVLGNSRVPALVSWYAPCFVCACCLARLRVRVSARVRARCCV